MHDRPPAEQQITGALVAELLADQHPDLSRLEIEAAGEGWDNAMFRLGPELAVRLPRRQAAVALIENEQRWLPHLAPRLPIAVPTPRYLGRPGAGFPWPWTVVPWMEGRVAIDAPFDDPVVEGERLGRFLRSLHRPAHRDAPLNPYRGQDATALAARLGHNLTMVAPGELGGHTPEAILGLWEQAVDVPRHDGEACWVHGDLHGLNLLVDNGRIAAVIDFGDLTSGDPAVDLPIGWMVFDGQARRHFRSVSGADTARWSRGWAWAMHFAVLYLANSADHPALRRQGARLFAALIDDRPPFD